MKCSIYKKKKTCPLCYRLWSDVKVQDMMTPMRHMLLDGHLAEQTDTKIPQEQEVKIPHAVHYWKSGCQSDLLILSIANSYAVASPLIIVGETKTKNDWQPGFINDTMHLVKQHPPLQTANMYTLCPPMCITLFTSLYIAPSDLLTEITTNIFTKKTSWNSYTALLGLWDILSYTEW